MWSLGKGKEANKLATSSTEESEYLFPSCNDWTEGTHPTSESYAPIVTGRIFDDAIRVKASDVHLQASPAGVDVFFRIDGTLHPIGDVPLGKPTSVLQRVKALAGLLTYRTDVPQEGRMLHGKENAEFRVSTIPTLHGERVVVRLSLRRGPVRTLDQLALPEDATIELRRALTGPSGVILIAGKAGSGKTTTAYASLSYLAEAKHRRCIVSLEDPIEIEVRGVAQSQINLAAGYDWSSGLKALLRQDPEVLFVGEIRDAETASVVFHAGLTGQLVVSTMHGGNVCEAVRRLIDMRIPTDLIRSGLRLLMAQRLMRRICPCRTGDAKQVSAQDVSSRGNTELREPTPNCLKCNGTGYSDRFPLAEILPPIDGPLAKCFLEQSTTFHLEQTAIESGMIPFHKRAETAKSDGWTTTEDARRVALGY